MKRLRLSIMKIRSQWIKIQLNNGEEIDDAQQ